MKKLAITVNVIFTALLLVGTVLYQTVGGRTVHYSTSGVFALMGLVNLAFAIAGRTKNLKFYITMSLGLILCMLGDILLGKDFVIGAATFALGHVCYFIAYCFRQKPRKTDFVIGGVLFLAAGAFLMFCPLLAFDAAYKQWVCLAYALIISMMVGKAFGNYLAEKNVCSLLLAIGSATFFFSYLMLVLHWFMDTDAITGQLCMITYFPAQCFLGLAMLVSIFCSKEKAN